VQKTTNDIKMLFQKKDIININPRKPALRLESAHSIPETHTINYTYKGQLLPHGNQGARAYVNLLLLHPKETLPTFSTD
jgi:hypothetical protein